MISPPFLVDHLGYSLLSWLACAIFVILAIFMRRDKVGISHSIPIPFLAYFIATAIITTTAYIPLMAFFGVSETYANGLCQVALVVAASGLNIDRRVFRTFVRLLVVLVCLQALIQYAFPYVKFLTPYGIWFGRSYAPFGSPIFLGAWLAVAGAWVIPGSSWPYWLLWGLALAATKTRGAMLAAVVGLLITNRKVLYRFLMANKAVMSVPFILVMAWGAFRQDGVSKSDSGRIALYAVCAKAIKERPFFGWGPENAVYAIQKHRDNRFNEIYGPTTQGHCHNQLLEDAIAGGALMPLVTLLLALWIFLHMTGDSGRGAFAAYACVGLFNPIPISVSVLGALIVSANLRKMSSVKISPILFATGSLVAALYCARNYNVMRDSSLPMSVRFPAAKAIGIVD